MRCRSRTRTGCGRRTGRCRRRRPRSGPRRRVRHRAGPSAVSRGPATRTLSSAVAFFIFASTATRSASSSAAIRRRVLPAMSRGRTVARIALACRAVRSFLAWPGTSSASSRCSRLTVWTRSRVSSSRRSAQHPQRLELTVAAQHPQRRGADRDDRDRVGVAGIGLAVVAGVEEPHPGSELGRHVHDVLAGLEEPLRQRPAGAVASLDRPDPLRPVLRIGPHRGVAGLVGAEPARAEQLLASVDDLDRRRQLVGIDPDDHLRHRSPASSYR